MTWTAREAWARIYPLLDAALSVNYIAAVKVALERRRLPGRIDPREPVAPLDPADACRITELAVGVPPAARVLRHATARIHPYDRPTSRRSDDHHRFRRPRPRSGAATARPC